MHVSVCVVYACQRAHKTHYSSGPASPFFLLLQHNGLCKIIPKRQQYFWARGLGSCPSSRHCFGFKHQLWWGNQGNLNLQANDINCCRASLYLHHALDFQTLYFQFWSYFLHTSCNLLLTMTHSHNSFFAKFFFIAAEKCGLGRSKLC